MPSENEYNEECEMIDETMEEEKEKVEDKKKQ